MIDALAFVKRYLTRDAAIVLAALAVGAAALYLADSYLEHREAQFRAAVTQEHAAATTQVVVAKTDLPAGSEISERTLAVRAMPSDYVHREAVRPERFDDVKGRYLGRPLEKGRALLYSYVAEGITGFSDAIASGRRALTLHVDEVSSINGLVRPGDRLDLLMTTRGGAGPAVRPLLWGVKVLATGSLTDDAAVDARRDSARRYSTITLEVTPEEAEQVILAREAGQVTAMLRRRTGDTDDRRAPPAVGDAVPAPAAAARGREAQVPTAPTRMVDYILGGRSDGVPEYMRVPLDVAAEVAAGRAVPRPPAAPAPANVPEARPPLAPPAPEHRAVPAAGDAIPPITSGAPN